MKLLIQKKLNILKRHGIGANRVSKFFLFSFLFYSLNSGATEQKTLDLISKSDIAQLKTMDSKPCVVKLYLKSISLSDSTRCDTTSFLEGYLQLHTLYFKHLIVQNYSKALSVQYEMLKLLESSKDANSLKEYINTTQNNITLLKELENIVSTTTDKPLKVTTDFKVELAGKEHLVDTGAIYSTSPELNTAYTLEVRDYFGNESKKRFSITEINGISNIVVMNHPNHILGLQYMMKFESLIMAGNPKKATSQVQFDLFFDSGTVFFMTAISIDGKYLLDTRVCLDSGADETLVVNPNFVEPTKSDEKERRAYVTSGGFNLVSTAHIDSMSVGKMTIKDVKVILGNNVNYTCDVILGRDFLSPYLKKIDWRQRTVHFTH